MNMTWVIILNIYFYNSSGRIDIKPTGLEFETALKCNEFRLSDECRARLKLEYKGKNVSYVHPICKMTEKKELYASKGICQISACLW